MGYIQKNNKKDNLEKGKISIISSYYRLLAFLTPFFTFLFSLFTLLLLSLDGFCQPGAELGVTVGGGYYIGEYNQRAHFKYMQPYWGGFYRYNLNDRFALRLNAGLSKIDVQEVYLPGEVSNHRPYPMEFHTSLVDVNAVLEFNFRSFMVRKVEKSSLWSPYIFAGIGFLSGDKEGGINIPMGIGVKFNLYRQFSFGVEWSGRKLFTDKLDGVGDAWKTGETNFVYNKDWFFVTAFTISYRFPVNPECHF